MTFLVTVTLRQKRQSDGNVRQREKIIVLNNVGLRAGQLAVKPAHSVLACLAALF
jgi:hypothetical protein